MAVTRSFLKGMGLTEEQVSAVIEEHTNTINGLKAERDANKAAADKVTSLEAQIDELKKSDWKEKYETEHKAFDEYKSKVESEKTLGEIRTAYRNLLKAQHVSDKDMDLVMDASEKTISGLKMKDGKLDGEEALAEAIKTKFARYITKQKTDGADPETPPDHGDNKPMSRAEIYAKDEHGRYKLTTAERQKALAEAMQNQNT